MQVTVFTKPGCHLCEDALVILDRLTPQYALEVSEVNILDDMALYDAYHEKIPVIMLEGGRLGVLEAPVDEPGLRAAFEIARHGMPTTAENGAASVLPRQKQAPLLDRMAIYIGRHWLRFVTATLAIFVGLPWLAPIFAGWGWWGLADPIYTAYAFTCHQLPERAGSVMGYQVAFCYRNTALYGGAALFGVLFALGRDNRASWLAWLKKPISWPWLVLLLVPLAADGITHMLGLRDNPMDMMDASFGSFYIGSQLFSLNWWLRIITGLLAALGVVWFAYPRMEKIAEESEELRRLYDKMGSEPGMRTVSTNAR